MDLSPKIVAFVSDLYFTSRIQSAAEKLGFQVVWFDNESLPANTESQTPARQPGEQLSGPGALLLDLLTQLHPSLIIFDLGNTHIPWRQWLPLIKSAPATRRIPVIAFGPHVDHETMKLARSSGADEVVARSRFVQALGDLIKKQARYVDRSALKSACGDSLSELAIQGLEEFNQGLYFEAHESLESAWIEDTSAGRELYRAILQVAVAYLQIERGNYRGAMKMFLRMRQWIDPLPDTCRGVDVASLRQAAYEVHAQLKSLGQDNVGAFDRRLLRPVVFHI